MLDGNDAPTPGEGEQAGNDPIATIRFVITPDLKRRLDRIAAARGLTYEEMVSEALRAWLNAEEDDAV